MRRPACLPLLLLGLAAASGLACKTKVPTITEPWSDTFERIQLGGQWNNTGAEYRIVNGRLNISGAHNHPLWLRQRLPRDVVVELDVMSKSATGDIKVELFGDGESFDPDQGQYDATGYVFVFGGWGNTSSIIGRKGEHVEQNAVKAARSDVPVIPGKGYHFTITRKGATIDWKIDRKPFLSFTDPEPLEGESHGFFGVNNWESDVYFDNLDIRPAP